MKTRKSVLVIVSLFFVAAIIVILVFSKGKETPDGIREPAVRQVEIESSEPEEEADAGFLVKLSDGRVILYRELEGSLVEIEGIEIDTEYYPIEDIRALTEGISVSSEGDGYALLENFAS